jgi:hypothetical protein
MSAYWADENVVSFQPDMVVLEEFCQTCTRRISLEPEMALMLAVLEEAISCFQRYVLAPGGKGKRLFREAEQWITEKDSEWLFSFDNVCEAVGLSPGFVRSGLLRWKEQQLAKNFGAQILPFEGKRRKLKRRFALAPRNKRLHHRAAGWK